SASSTPMVLAEGHKQTMALDQSALLEALEALKAAEVDDRIRQAAETIYQALIEAEPSSVIGAVPHQRTDSRTAWRSGHRPRTVTTTAGELELRILKLRAGSFFPSLLERRRRQVKFRVCQWADDPVPGFPAAVSSRSSLICSGAADGVWCTVFWLRAVGWPTGSWNRSRRYPVTGSMLPGLPRAATWPSGRTKRTGPVPLSGAGACAASPVTTWRSLL